MKKGNFSQKEKTRKIVTVGMLSGICIFLGLTGLGIITIPPVSATILHIPVIIGAIIEGPVVGALVGLIFGLFSIYQAFAVPTVTSFVFWNPIVAVLPRILIGVFSYYAYRAALKGAYKNLKATSLLFSVVLAILAFLFAESFLGAKVGLIIAIIAFIVIFAFLLLYKNKKKEDILSIGIGATVGTLTNTIGVLFLIYVFYLDRFAAAIGVSKQLATGAVISVGVVNGIPETIASILISIPVVMAVQKIRKK
ncbi:MAG: ECF transporter S component [Sarcina sp.]